MEQATVFAPAVIMYDWDLLNQDDEIGRGTYPISELPDGDEEEIWLDIKEQKPKGDNASKVSQV